jgi:hypothetical protein
MRTEIQEKLTRKRPVRCSHRNKGEQLNAPAKPPNHLKRENAIDINKLTIGNAQILATVRPIIGQTK